MGTIKIIGCSSFLVMSGFVLALAFAPSAAAQEPPASTDDSPPAPGAAGVEAETTSTTPTAGEDAHPSGEPEPAAEAEAETDEAPEPGAPDIPAEGAPSAPQPAVDDTADEPDEEGKASETLPTANEAAPEPESDAAGASSNGSPETKKKPKVADATIIEPAPAPSQGKFQLRYSSLNTVRVNPLGLISINTIGARFKLYDSDNALLKDNYVGIAVRPTLSGAFARGGVLAEVQPLSILRLWAAFDALYFFGIFSLFQSFEDPKADYSDSRISELASIGTVNDPRRNYATFGTQATVGVDFKIKIGPVAARSLTRLVRSDFNMRQGDRVFYDQLYDMLSPNNGVMFTNDTDLLGYFDLGALNLFKGMRVVGGIRNTVTAGLYDESRYAPEDPDATTTNIVRRTFADNAIWRVGPLVSLTLFDEPGALFNKPTIFMAAQWHILHRWRTDADVSRLIPYTFLGFAFSGDFLNL